MDKIAMLLTLTAEDPKDPLAWFMLGEAYIQQGSYHEALRAFSESLQYADEPLRQKISSRLSDISSIMQQPGGNLNENEPIEKKDDYTEVVSNELSANNEGNTDNVRSFRALDGGRQKSPKSTADGEIPTITFSDVGGLDNLKETISLKIVKPFMNPGLFEKFKKKSGGGILLFGPPGCGKTFIARATAGECRARFITVHISDVLDPYFGGSEQNLRDIFSTARASRPSVLFFDELDALGYSRAKSGSSMLRSVGNEFLSLIDGIDTNMEKMLLIGATNMPWDVDSAFLRPGRFDRVLFVSPPDEKARQVIFRLKMADRPADQIDYGVLAKRTELYSGADIENVVELATESLLTNIMKTGIERPLSMEDLLRAIDETIPSTIEWLRTIKNYVRYANQAGRYNDVERFLSKHKLL